MNPRVDALEQYKNFKDEIPFNITTTSLSARGIPAWINYRLASHWAGAGDGGQFSPVFLRVGATRTYIYIYIFYFKIEKYQHRNSESARKCIYIYTHCITCRERVGEEALTCQNFWNTSEPFVRTKTPSFIRNKKQTRPRHDAHGANTGRYSALLLFDGYFFGKSYLRVLPFSFRMYAKLLLLVIKMLLYLMGFRVSE